MANCSTALKLNLEDGERDRHTDTGAAAGWQGISPCMVRLEGKPKQDVLNNISVR